MLNQIIAILGIPTLGQNPRDLVSVHNHFNHERHLVSRDIYKARRSAALAEWQTVMGCGSASKEGPRPFLPQVIGTKPLSQIDWGSRPTPISTTLAAFDAAFEYLSMTRRGPALDADPHRPERKVLDE